MIFKKTIFVAAAVVMLAGVVAFTAYEPSYAAVQKTNCLSSQKTVMKVKSSGIKNGYIQKKYGYHFLDHSIPLTIMGVPAKTRYLAVYMYDESKDAYHFVHWIAANISKTSSIKENASSTMKVQGQNSNGDAVYMGPCPPETHTYVIKVYALSSRLSLKNGFTLSKFKKAIKGKVLASASLKGKYRHYEL